MILHPYKLGSKSCKELKGLLIQKGEKTLVTHREPRGPKPFIVSWGSRPIEYPPRQGMQVLNHPILTNVMSDKLKFFRKVGHECPYIPEWATPAEGIAKTQNWDTTVVRHKTAGQGGEGIELVHKGTDVPKAPLYVKYQKKTDEYRLHLFRERDFSFGIRHRQKKVAREGVEIKNWQVRNLENGFIFQQNDFEVPVMVTHTALRLMEEHFPDLDFCALDVIYHEPSDVALVLEGNTAPGLQGKTIEVYADYFLERKQW